MFRAAKDPVLYLVNPSGVDDESRYQKRGGFTARVGDDVAISVDDGFLTSSRVVALRAPATSLQIDIAPTRNIVKGCLWLTP